MTRQTLQFRVCEEGAVRFGTECGSRTVVCRWPLAPSPYAYPQTMWHSALLSGMPVPRNQIDGKIRALLLAEYRRHFIFSSHERLTSELCVSLSNHQAHKTAWRSRNRVLLPDLATAVKQARAHHTQDSAFELLDAMGNLFSSGLSGAREAKIATDLLERINDSLPGYPAEYRPVVTDCGHIELACDTRVTAGRHGCPTHTACSNCVSHGDYVYTCDGYLELRNNVYLWSDGEFYYTGEDEDSDDEYSDDEYSDDEDNEVDPNYRLNYDVNVMEFLNVEPSFETSAHGDFHMGIELETQVSEGRSFGIHQTVADTRVELGEDYLVGKADGSIGDNGIEWVTRPTSMAVHVDKFKSWTYTIGRLRAWNAQCCGMHIHLDSRAFTALTLGKFVQFFNLKSNIGFVRQIAGRHPALDGQAASYAAMDLNPSDAVDPIKALKGKGQGARYVMVNLTNLDRHESARLKLSGEYGSSNTVEVRVFRASLKKERLLAQIEFTHALVIFCRTAGYRDLSGVAFCKWLKNNCGPYPNLARWYGIAQKHGLSTQAPARPRTEEAGATSEDLVLAA